MIRYVTAEYRVLSESAAAAAAAAAARHLDIPQSGMFRVLLSLSVSLSRDVAESLLAETLILEATTSLEYSRGSRRVMRLRGVVPLCLKEPELPAVAAAASAAVTASRATWRYHCRLADKADSPRVSARRIASRCVTSVGLASARFGSNRPPRDVADASSSPASSIEHLDPFYFALRFRARFATALGGTDDR